ncbi:CoA transferase [Mycobacterium vicinigordonae]|uniref:CoA transferase n=1 Tax=Mycobacterium vicinigordonae TaxID=1719132 RepID=A0A7D6EAC4_9MYCO|nr:CoA transferase [Mycobacterium vicinigordonae]
MRVLQLGDGIAGSAAAALLASLGALVAKVSTVRKAERTGPLINTAAGSLAAVDITLDREKRIAAADSDLTKLIGEHDIVILDYGRAVTLPQCEGVVVVSVSPFGLDGPRAAQSGGEIVAQATGGLLSTIEGSGGVPVPVPGYVALKAAGAVTALAALHGLDRRNSTNTAVYVDVSVQEAVASTAVLPECAHLLYGCPGRAGSGRYLAPSGLFNCRDGLVRITAVENHQWRGLLVALDDPAWAAGLDERPARIEHADLINRHVADWAATREKASCAKILQANGVPSTPVNTPEEILTSSQFVFRGAVTAAQIAGVDVSVLGPPWLTHPGGPSTRHRTGRLSELRIVELTHVLAGPIIGALLGAMGAGVLRLEDPDRLDIYRRTGPFAAGKPGVERGAYFSVANHSKESLLIEPSRAVQDVAAAMADCDVVIENIGASRLGRLGLDPDAVAASGRLAVRVSGFGSAGPLAGYRVYANNVQSYGGLAGLTVDAAGSPARLSTVIADPLSSMVAAVVIAAWALGPARDTGAVVDLSMAEVVASTVAEFVTAASVEVPLVADGAAHRGVYRAADERWVAVELAQSTALKADELAAVVAAGAAEEVAVELNALGAQAAVVQRAEDLIADPHLAARGFFPEITHPDPEIATARLVGLPWRFAGLGPVPLAAPPALGSANARQERMISAR